MDPRIVHASRQHAPRFVRLAKHEIQHRADDQHGDAELHQPAANGLHPPPEAEQRRLCLVDEWLLRFDEFEEPDRPANPDGRLVEPVHCLTGIGKRERSLTHVTREEVLDVGTQVVPDGELVADCSEHHEHLQVGDDAGREGELVVADPPHGVHREARIRVGAGRASGRRGRLGAFGSRLVARLDVGRAHLVDERTMHADEIRARGFGIRAGRRSEPAHELRDSGIDVALEEQPAVPGQRIARSRRGAARRSRSPRTRSRCPAARTGSPGAGRRGNSRRRRPG